MKKSLKKLLGCLWLVCVGAMPLCVVGAAFIGSIESTGSMGLVNLGSLAFDQTGLTEEEIAQRKAIIHQQITGEVLGQDQIVLRRMRVMASSVLGATTGALVERVVGKQMSDRTVQISYDLNSDYQCNVKCDISIDGTFLSEPLSFAEGSHVGIVSGAKNRLIVWNAMSDWPNGKSDRVKARITAEETDVPQTWAHITIAWAAWGGRDIDICGYWIDQPSIKVGYSHGSGSSSATHKSIWRGDNTGSGPEYVLVGVAPDEILSGVTTRKYRIHFNHYGVAASNPQVKVTVSGNGTTRSKTCRAGTRQGSAANTSDPYVTITFDQQGTPTSVE